MPLRTKTGKAPPPGFEIIEPILEALENELRDKVKESNLGKRNTESIWPVHQINWQKTRYVYDMYFTYKHISKEVYDYCVKNKLIDAPLIAKWKKPGYERLCSTYVINPANYKFGTTSICRVPMKDRNERHRNAQDPTTGCFGCASGKDAGPKNIFGNKYGQNLAAIQIARIRRMEAQQAKGNDYETDTQRKYSEDFGEDETHIRTNDSSPNAPLHPTNEGESETDDATTDDEDDYGPSPAAGIWAGTQKLEAESESITKEGGEYAGGQEEEEEYDHGDYVQDDNGNENKIHPSKKIRMV